MCHSSTVAVRRQLSRVRSLLLPCGTGDEIQVFRPVCGHLNLQAISLARTYLFIYFKKSKYLKVLGEGTANHPRPGTVMSTCNRSSQRMSYEALRFKANISPQDDPQEGESYREGDGRGERGRRMDHSLRKRGLQFLQKMKTKAWSYQYGKGVASSVAKGEIIEIVILNIFIM